ncbi:glycosyltransferase [Legionella fairfieldensis]|uniref:glycosyltransferase n=1 Tax=Legionella fairfieldensis TaxID=45064 RepID=UPI00048EF9B8|nr:glycosyltransferase [Legionella fairfieldensis]
MNCSALKKLLIVIPGKMPTVDIITRTLHYLPHYELKIVTENTLSIKDVFSGHYILLFMRLCSPSLQPLLKSLIRFNIKYLYYLDDNFWEIKGNNPLANYHQHPSVLKTLTDFVEHAYCVVTGSEQLKNYVKQYQKNTIHMKAAFSFDLLKNIQKAPSSDKIKILYSGSQYRCQDFSCVIPALKKISEDYQEKISIHFYGYIPEALKTLNNIYFDENFYPYDDFIKEQYRMGFDIGLAPVADLLSNRAKSNLKYREYGACGIAGIYTDQPPYSDCIQNQETGILVQQTTEAWYHALKNLIENVNLRRHISSMAYKDIFTNYQHQNLVPAWQELFDKLPVNKKPVGTMVFYSSYDKIAQVVLSLFYKIRRVGSYARYHGILFTCKKIIKALSHE